MNFFKYIFTALIALLFIQPVSAKQTGTKPTYTKETQVQPLPQVQPKPQTQIPSKPSAQTFKQLVDYVKNSNSATVWNNQNKLLKQNFVADIVTKAKNANLNEDQLDILLIIARDFHAQFTGNNAQDIGVLIALEQQREVAQESL